MIGLHTIVNHHWHDPWREDDLAWREFDDAYLAEWRAGQGKLVEAMDAMWRAMTEANGCAPEYIVCSEAFARELGLVVNAPRWLQLWWDVKYGVLHWIERLRGEED
jgi:hypothetical protein